MVKISEAWHSARLEVLDEFWDDKIDFELFKKKIEEVDRSFSNIELNNEDYDLESS